METHSTQEQLTIRNENLDIHHKRNENYKGEETEAKKSKFECGAKAVVDETSKHSITNDEKGDEGLGSPKAGNNITKKSTLPGVESLAELEEALKDEANWFSRDQSAWLVIDDEEESLAPSDWDAISLKDNVPVIPRVERPKRDAAQLWPLQNFGEYMHTSYQPPQNNSQAYMVCETRNRQCLAGSVPPLKSSKTCESTGDNFCHRLAKLSSGAPLGDDIGLWPPRVADVFVAMMEAEVDKNGLNTSTFSTKVWSGFVTQMKSETNRTFSKQQLKDKYNRLRSKYREFKKIINQTGFGWDHEAGTVTAEDTVWESYIKANKGAAPFRKRGLENYEALCKIFEKSTASGKLARASTQGPLNSNEEREMGEEFANIGNSKVEPELGDDVDDVESVYGGRRKATSQVGNRHPRKSLKNSMEACFQALALASLAKVERYKSESYKYESSNDRSMETCMKELGDMSGIDDSMFFKAIEKFVAKKEYRIAFIAMSNELKLKWILHL